MTQYQRPPPAIDCQIEEIPQGKHRVRIVGSIVNVGTQSLTINDGSGQVRVSVRGSTDEYVVGQLGRFIAEVVVQEEQVSGSLIAWHEVTADQAKRYRRLVKIERRVPKK